MPLIDRRRVTAMLAGAVATVTAARADETYPNRTVRIIVPYAPGGLPDTVARIVAQRLQTRIGQPVVIENRPGGNGNVAAGAIAAAAADGYTLMITDGSMITINPLLARLSYDPQRDFIPVAMMARAPLFLAVHPSVPVENLDGFITHVRSVPGQLNYGSSGIGSTHHLSMEAIKAAMRLDIQHVPFRGTGQSVPALVGGQVQALFSAYPSLSGFWRDGRVRILATNGAERSPLAPDVPPIASLIPGFDFAPTIGLFAPRGTPDAIVTRLAREIAATAQMPDVVQAFAAGGIEARPLGSAAYARALAEEGERARAVVTSLGLKPE